MILTGQLAQKLFNRQQIKLYFGYDHLGTIKRLYNEQRQLVKAIEYDSFGNILEETLPELFIPLGFAGGVLDKDTRFIQYCYRNYYPYIGRFTCIDPAKAFGTDGDYYDYCSDDPVGRFDPLGLFTLPIVSTYTLPKNVLGRDPEFGNDLANFSLGVLSDYSGRQITKKAKQYAGQAVGTALGGEVKGFIEDITSARGPASLTIDNILEAGKTTIKSYRQEDKSVLDSLNDGINNLKSKRLKDYLIDPKGRKYFK